MVKADKLLIKKVAKDTFADFLGLVAKLAEYEELAPPDEEAKVRLQRDCLSDNPKFQAFLGKIEGKYVSYVLFFFTYSSFLALPTLFLEDIFVLKEYRRQTVGEGMFNFIKETAKREGCGAKVAAESSLRF